MFITFRLHGTLPLTAGRDGRAFALADRELERMDRGPSWLRKPRIAECVMETVRRGYQDRALYQLLSFVIMPNHVHLLINPSAPGPKITQYVKGISAKQANALLGRTGQPFWQDESYDRRVRSLRKDAKSFGTSNRIRCARIWLRRRGCFDIRALLGRTQTRWHRLQPVDTVNRL